MFSFIKLTTKFKNHPSLIGSTILRDFTKAAGMVAINALNFVAPGAPLLLTPLWDKIVPQKSSYNFSTSTNYIEPIVASDPNFGYLRQKVDDLREKEKYIPPISLESSLSIHESMPHSVQFDISGVNPFNGLPQTETINAVRLPRNFLLRTPKKEVKSVLLHEVGHHATPETRTFRLVNKLYGNAFRIVKYTTPFAVGQAVIAQSFPGAIAKINALISTKISQLPITCQDTSSPLDSIINLAPLMNQVNKAVPLDSLRCFGAELMSTVPIPVLSEQSLINVALSASLLIPGLVVTRYLSRRAEYAADRFAFKHMGEIDSFVNHELRVFTGNNPYASIPMKLILEEPKLLFCRSHTISVSDIIFNTHPHTFARIRAAYQHARLLGLKPKLSTKDTWRAQPYDPDRPTYSQHIGNEIHNNI